MSLGIARSVSHGAGEWLECGQMGKQLDIISSSHTMKSAAIIVGIENDHFNIQIRTAKSLRMKFKFQSGLNNVLVE